MYRPLFCYDDGYLFDNFINYGLGSEPQSLQAAAI